MLNLIKRSQENLKKKEVKRMKRICILAVAASMLLALAIPVAFADPISSSTSGTIIHISYNAYGIATSQTTTTNGTVTTQGDLYYKDMNGNGKYDKGEELTKATVDEKADEDLDGDGIKGEKGVEVYYYLGPDGSDADDAPDPVYVLANNVKTIKNGSFTSTNTVTTVTSTWHNGGLRTNKAVTDSNSSTYVDANQDGKADDITGDGVVDDRDKILTTESQTTDLYSYDANGNLTGVIGKGWYKQYSTFVNSNGTQTRYKSGEGTITKTYETRDGQALLKQTLSVGNTFDKDGKDIGDSIQKEVYSDWVYKAGQWVSNKLTTQGLSVTHAAQNGLYSTGITLDTSAKEILKRIKNKDDISISSVERVEKTQTYTRNAAGIITGLSLAYNTDRKSSFRFVVTGQNTDGTPSIEGSYIEQVTGKSWAEAKFDPKQGWYISDEWYQWEVDPNWSGGTWGDPAVTGTVSQRNNNWYMNVNAWTNDDKTTHQTVTIELNLDALKPEQRAAMEQVLQEYRASGEQLTLYGLSQNETISQGTKLVAMGLGKGSFTAHPFDFEGDIPDALAGGVKEDFAEFVASMITAPYANRVFGGLSAEARWQTFDGLHNALMGGNLKIGGSFTTSGNTFKLVTETHLINGGAGARLDAILDGNVVHVRHFTNELCRQLGLL